MKKTQWRKRACYTDLVREKVGRPCYLFHAHCWPCRSPHCLWCQLWFSGSKCSPTCYLPPLSTGGEDKKEGREIKEKGQSKLVSFVKILLCLLPIWVCSTIFLLSLLSSCLYESCSHFFKQTCHMLYFSLPLTYTKKICSWKLLVVLSFLIFQTSLLVSDIITFFKKMINVLSYFISLCNI